MDDSNPGSLHWPQPKITDSLPEITDPAGYRPAEGLREVVQTALDLGMPLLLTGEPGVGKSRLAHWAASQLPGCDEPIEFDVKSTSEARDLLYHYDALADFRASHRDTAKQPDRRQFIDYRGLGLAILRACEEQTVADFVSERFQHGGQRRSVVLVDEIDKAPRDLPNDLLMEFDRMAFRVPELGGELGQRYIQADEAQRPLVVITSNSERNLPGAFLRRCVFFHIDSPKGEALAEILDSRLGSLAPAGCPLRDELLELYHGLRGDPLAHKPGLAELLNALRALHHLGATAGDSPKARPEWFSRIAATLAKTVEDNPNFIALARHHGWQAAQEQGRAR